MTQWTDSNKVFRTKEVKPMRKDSEKMMSLFEESIEVLRDELKMDDVTSRSKLAATLISSYTRLKATERGGDTLTYAVVRDFAGGDENLKELIKGSLPEYAPKEKQLVGK